MSEDPTVLGIPRELVVLLGKEAARQLYHEVRKAYAARKRQASPFLMTFREAATYQERLLPHEQNRRGLFCHVLVYNGTGQNVKRCVGTLESVAVWNGDAFIPDRDFTRSLRLTWANRLPDEPPEIDLAPYGMVRLDLCYTVEGLSEFRFAVPRGPHGIRTDFGPGLYRALVRVQGDGVADCDARFIVKHRGMWNAIKAWEFIADDVRSLVTPAEWKSIQESADSYTKTNVASLRSDNSQWIAGGGGG